MGPCWDTSNTRSTTIIFCLEYLQTAGFLCEILENRTNAAVKGSCIPHIQINNECTKQHSECQWLKLKGTWKSSSTSTASISRESLNVDVMLDPVLLLLSLDMSCAQFTTCRSIGPLVTQYVLHSNSRNTSHKYHHVWMNWTMTVVFFPTKIEHPRAETFREEHKANNQSWGGS